MFNDPHSGLPYLVALIFCSASLWQELFCKDDSKRWLVASIACFTTLGAAVFSLCFTVIIKPALAEPVPLLMMVLVTTIAAVLCRFSRNYLRGLSGQSRFLNAFLLTLAGVSALVATNHLGVLVLAWSASSLFLHRLLTFFEDRPLAHLAARKKYIVSRIAEACLLAALFLIQKNLGTLDILHLSDALAQNPLLAAAPQMQLAGILLSAAVVLKTAQFPLHGWILQVMEAPTPVSALLHAGVVNIGGYVLIRMAFLVSAVPAAQLFLVVAGCTTAMLAGFVTLTRVSIKVKLAWSTCAQMGFMLVECGLGLYELAFVHLIAHSFYKAHAFLSCGTIVGQTIQEKMVQLRYDSKSISNACAHAACGVALMWGIGLLWHHLRPGAHPHFALLILPGLALAPLVQDMARLYFKEPRREACLALAQVLLVALATLFIHTEARGLLFLNLPHSQFEAGQISRIGQDGLILLVVLAFLLFYLAQSLVLTKPLGRFAQKIYPWVYGGFYVDEIFTRFICRLKPPGTKPSAVAQKQRGSEELARI